MRKLILEVSCLTKHVEKIKRRAMEAPLGESMGDPDPEISKRVTEAMLKRQKVIVADAQKAYGG